MVLGTYCLLDSIQELFGRNPVHSGQNNVKDRANNLTVKMLSLYFTYLYLNSIYYPQGLAVSFLLSHRNPPRNILVQNLLCKGRPDMFLLPLPSSLFPAPAHGETEHAFQINAHMLKSTHTTYKLATTQTEKTLASKVSYIRNTHIVSSSCKLILFLPSR